MKNIFLIPTQEASNYYIWDNKLRFGDLTTAPKNLAIYNQFIYITDNSEIKFDNWYYLPKENKVHKCPKVLKLQSVTPEWTQKIVLTNDQSLSGVQQLTKEQLQKYCSNPVDSVEVFSVFEQDD